jgi:hypothetical protein
VGDHLAYFALEVQLKHYKLHVIWILCSRFDIKCDVVSQVISANSWFN